MKKPVLRALALSILLACTSAQADAVQALLKKYEGQGGRAFTTASGEVLWKREFTDARTGEKRRCSQCHHEDLRKQGKHATTGKSIEPLAPSVNPKRLTDEAHIEKWFSRNCKWTFGRECTPQEKGDFLAMIRTR